MGISVRHYVFPDGGEPQRLPDRVADGLIAGSDSLPAFAETSRRILHVILDNEDGQPKRILRTEAAIWFFDEEGKADKRFREAIYDRLAIPVRSGHETVIDIGPELHRKRIDRIYRWEPEREDIEKVVADIWPKKGAPRLKLVKSTAPKRPPLTWSAKEALRQATEPFFKIMLAFDGLKEPSLKGLAFEARERSAHDPDYRPLYSALAEMAERRLEILRRHRSGKGVWYASVEVIRWDLTDRHGETIASYHERCDGKRAAEAVARRLLAEHADKFASDTTVEASVVTDLEWSGSE